MNKKLMFTTDYYVPEKRNIVFLDIDGVIASYDKDDRYFHDLEKTREYLINKYKDNIYLKISKEDIGASFYDWSLVALGRLRLLLDETYSEIVLHSDYRDGNTKKTIKALFKIHGMDEYILDMCKGKGSKIEVIKEYLEAYKDVIENYVIFDDDDRLNCLDNFILTNNLLSDKNVEDACKILMK